MTHILRVVLNRLSEQRAPVSAWAFLCFGVFIGVFIACSKQSFRTKLLLELALSFDQKIAVHINFEVSFHRFPP